jgi:hypothetical protein
VRRGHDEEEHPHLVVVDSHGTLQAEAQEFSSRRRRSFSCVSRRKPQKRRYLLRFLDGLGSDRFKHLGSRHVEHALRGIQLALHLVDLRSFAAEIV